MNSDLEDIWTVEVFVAKWVGPHCASVTTATFLVVTVVTVDSNDSDSSDSGQ